MKTHVSLFVISIYICCAFTVSLKAQILVLNLKEHSTQSRQSLMGASWCCLATWRKGSHLWI